jgi:hypothetical protein
VIAAGGNFYDPSTGMTVGSRPAGYEPTVTRASVIRSFKHQTQAKGLIGEPRLQNSAPTVTLHKVTFQHILDPHPGLRAGIPDPSWVVVVSVVPAYGHGGRGAPPPGNQVRCVAVATYDLKLHVWTNFEKSWCTWPS